MVETVAVVLLAEGGGDADLVAMGGGATRTTNLAAERHSGSSSLRGDDRGESPQTARGFALAPDDGTEGVDTERISQSVSTERGGGGAGVEAARRRSCLADCGPARTCALSLFSSPVPLQRCRKEASFTKAFRCRWATFWKEPLFRWIWKNPPWGATASATARQSASSSSLFSSACLRTGPRPLAFAATALGALGESVAT